MATRDRPSISKYDYALLINEVDSLCPLCSESLIYSKNGKSANIAEAAHIYPHSPSVTENELLSGLPRITVDPDNIKNLLMLCPSCHTKFDHPRTVEEYLLLYQLKSRIIARQTAREYYKTHDIETEICEVFELLTKDFLNNENLNLSYNLINIDKKLEGCLQEYLPVIIKKDIITCYAAIRNILFEVEKSHPGISESFALSMKRVSNKYSRLNLSKDQIYESINDWLNQRTNNKYKLLTPYLTAFYIQNCEVF